MSIEKHFVFDDEGKLIEVRGYRDSLVSERWEIVYDESERVVGLRPLSVKEVIPQSILDRMKFWRKPKPLTQILSIDFIGLIQYIGMIYKIKKVVTIEEIEKILEIINIKKVDVIGEITTIRDLTWSPRSLIKNPSFKQGWTAWEITSNSDAVSLKENVYGNPFALCFKAGKLGIVGQELNMALDPSWWSWLDVRTYSPTIGDKIKVLYMKRDYTYQTETLTKTKAGFENFTLSPAQAFLYLAIRHEATETNDFDIYEFNMGF